MSYFYKRSLTLYSLFCYVTIQIRIGVLHALDSHCSFSYSRSRSNNPLNLKVLFIYQFFCFCILNWKRVKLKRNKKKDKDSLRFVKLSFCFSSLFHRLCSVLFSFLWILSATIVNLNRCLVIVVTRHHLRCIVSIILNFWTFRVGVLVLGINHIQ